MKIHKTTTKTLTGEITTYHVTDIDCLTFRVSTFKMDADYAKKNNDGKLICDLHVEAFDQDSFEWKDIIKTNDFSNDEIKAMIESDTVLVEVKDFLRSFFGIRMYDDANTEATESLPF